MLKTIIIKSEIQLTTEVVLVSNEEDTKFIRCIISIAIATLKITTADIGVIFEKYTLVYCRYSLLVS